MCVCVLKEIMLNTRGEGCRGGEGGGLVRACVCVQGRVRVRASVRVRARVRARVEG